jgi:hypothetical protein
MKTIAAVVIGVALGLALGANFSNGVQFSNSVQAESPVRYLTVWAGLLNKKGAKEKWGWDANKTLGDWFNHMADRGWFLHTMHTEHFIFTNNPNL